MTPRLASLGLVAFAIAFSPPALAVEPAASSAASSEVPTLDTLLDRYAKMPALSAKFTEEKQIALLAVPLRSEGTIHFSRGRGLVRHTTVPSRQSVLVTERDIVFWDGKATKRMSLGTSSVVDTFVQAFSFLLAANRTALDARFDLSFSAAPPPAKADAWRLVLSPKAPDVKKVISAIELSGRGLELSTLVVRESNGDVSTTRFSEVDVAKVYSAEEADRLFRVPP